jgi:hypothetical protein
LRAFLQTFGRNLIFLYLDYFADGMHTDLRAASISQLRVAIFAEPVSILTLKTKGDRHTH